MRFIGADLHKKSITFCVVKLVSGKVQVVHRRRILCSQPGKIEQYLKSHQPYQVVVEATIGYDWFAELAGQTAERTVVAHAGKLRVIAESTRKTDKIDAYVLAELLAKDMIPEAWRPSPRIRQHRSLVRRRAKIQSRITSIKNTMRGIMTRYNADRQDLFSKCGWNTAMQTRLLATERWLLEDLKEDLAQSVTRLAKLDARLSEFASMANDKEAEARALLATIPGVGPVTIEVVLAELGDWERFRCADAVASFAGLDPGVRQSDGKRYELKLSKSGSPLLRWIMIQLSHRLKRTSSRWKAVFERISKKAGKKKATCAVARRLMLVMYAVLRDGRPYQHAIAA